MNDNTKVTVSMPNTLQQFVKLIYIYITHKIPTNFLGTKGRQGFHSARSSKSLLFNMHSIFRDDADVFFDSPTIHVGLGMFSLNSILTVNWLLWTGGVSYVT